MKTSRRFPRSCAFLLGLLCFAIAGCDKKEPAKQEAPPAKPSAAAGSPAASGGSSQANSFDEVTARLDRGGPLYVYVSTQQWLAGLSQKVNSLRDFLFAFPDFNSRAAQRREAEAVFAVLADIAKKSGVEDISGVGASSVATDGGLFRNTLFVHHYRGKGNGLLWSAFGKAPHRLEPIGFLPADTALAIFGDADPAQILDFVKQEVALSGVPGAKEEMAQAIEQLSTVEGMPLDEALRSLGGSVGVILTLDPSKPISVPVERRMISIPAFRIALVVQVKNDRIFNQVDKLMGANPGIIRVDEGDLKMRTMQIPPMPPLTLRPTVAQWNGNLVIASDDSLLRDMIAAQKDGKGLKADSDFAKFAAGLPEEGNGFQIVAARFADAWNQLLNEAVKAQPGMPAEMATVMNKVMAFYKVAPSLRIWSHVDNGWLLVDKGSSDATATFLMPVVVTVPAIAASLAIPFFARTKVKAETAASSNNIRQLTVGCLMYASDNGGKFPPTLEELSPKYINSPAVFVSPFARENPMGFKYTPGLTDSSPASTVLIEDSFASRQNLRVVGFVDGHVETKPLR